VTTLGRDGGDASGADVVLVAVPGDAIAAALAGVKGPSGKTTIDATNRYGPVPNEFPSLTEQVKSLTHGPTAKAFNTTLAVLYSSVDAEAVPPGTMFVSEPEARQTTEQLIRDAGFDPIHLGDLSQAPLLESLVALTVLLDKGDLGPFFYRFNRPGELRGPA
jgi:predicted dinucleotide-binding enzyme